MAKFVGHSRVVRTLLLANGLSLFLFLFRVWSGQSLRYGFLPWNLLLAWLPAIFAALLRKRLYKKRFLDPLNLVLLALWLLFLPNSFYIVSDLIHLYDTGEVSMLYDAVLFMSFIFNGYLAGFLSVHIVHAQLLKRISERLAHSIITGVFLLCGFAIYLGRYMRWNTWDVVVHPLGVIFDASERVINPVAHPEALLTTMSFFVLIGSMYAVIFQFILATKLDTAKAVKRWIENPDPDFNDDPVKP